MIGKLIILEGPDSVGKSTLAKRILQSIHETEYSAILESFPGNREGSLGLLVYNLHHDLNRFGISKIDQTSLQLLHIAAHIDLIGSIIKPKLLQGWSVILDRFWWSTYVYGLVNGSPFETIDKMIMVEKSFWGILQPSLVLLIDREKPFDGKIDIGYWNNLRKLYQQLATEEENKYPVHIIKNDSDLQKIENKIIQEVLNTLESK